MMGATTRPAGFPKVSLEANDIHTHASASRFPVVTLEVQRGRTTVWLVVADPADHGRTIGHYSINPEDWDAALAELATLARERYGEE